jgi:hypothetical protein
MRDVYRKLELGNKRNEKSISSLSRDPAPKLKRFLANSPATREVAESPCVDGVLGESKYVLVVVQIELTNLQF